MNWLINRLHEPSTWRGLIWLLTAFGLSLKPEESEAIIVAGVALAGLFGVFTDDEPLPKIELQGRSESTVIRSGDHAVSVRTDGHGDQDSTQPVRMQSGVQPESKTDHGFNG